MAVRKNELCAFLRISCGRLRGVKYQVIRNIWKRYSALLCAAALLLCLTACKNENSDRSAGTAVKQDEISAAATDKEESGGSLEPDGKGSAAGNAAETPAPTAEPQPADAEPETPDGEGAASDWAARFSGGAIGENALGDRVLLAWDDPEDISYAALMLVPSDGGEARFLEGEVTLSGADDNVYYLLTDPARETKVPFNIYPSVKGDFDLFFRGTADTAEMNEVDHDAILDAFAQFPAAMQG